MAFHELLLRQLRRSGLSDTELPNVLRSWQNFLNHVHSTYQEFDQERYTLERSQDIVSREMQELIDNLHRAEQIARLGSWNRNFKRNVVEWSPETFVLFNRDPALGPPPYEEFLTYLHPEDRSLHQELFLKAKEEGIKFSEQIRVKQNENYIWIQANGEPYRDPNTQEIIGIRGTCLDITKSKEAVAYTEALHTQLVQEARKAGMADVATSVLHNVGNVLNSVNVTVTFLQESLKKCQASDLTKVLEILEQNKKELGPFFSLHPQGKHILEFLHLLTENMTKDKESMVSELKALDEHVQHIKNIISTQQSFGVYTAITEPIDISTLLEDAVIITSPGKKEQNGIEFVRKYEIKQPLITDKLKLSQLLVNIIKNARESIIENQSTEKKITISTRQEGNYAIISIKDTGIGINKTHLVSIFSHGFTTKKEGHGFGLHVSAISAKEMGGSLHAESEGKGRGATFILKLPMLQQGNSLQN